MINLKSLILTKNVALFTIGASITIVIAIFAEKFFGIDPALFAVGMIGGHTFEMSMR